MSYLCSRGWGRTSFFRIECGALPLELPWKIVAVGIFYRAASRTRTYEGLRQHLCRMLPLPLGFMAAKLDPILIPGIRTLLSLSMKQSASQDAWPLIDGNDLRVAVWIYAWNSLPPRIRTWIKGFVIPYAESITLTEERSAIGPRGVEPLRTALDFNGPGYESGPR